MEEIVPGTMADRLQFTGIDLVELLIDAFEFGLIGSVEIFAPCLF